VSGENSMLKASRATIIGMPIAVPLLFLMPAILQQRIIFDTTSSN